MGTATVAEEGAANGGRVSGARRVPTYLPPIVATVVAAALSVPRLGSRTMWLDEVYTVGATSELLHTWRTTGGTQALYYLLVWPVAQVSTEPAIMRLPSVVFMLAGLGVVYEVGRRIGGVRVGALAVGGMALSWGVARYSIEARSYTLALLLVSLSWLALVTLVPRGDPADRGPWWRVFVVATLLAPLAHGLSVLHLAVQFAALLVAPQGRAWLRRMVPVVVALGVELAALALMGARDIGDWVPPLHWRQLLGIGQLMLGFGVTGVVLTALTGAAAIDAVRRFWRDRSAPEWTRVVPVFWAFGPIVLVVAISLVRPYAASRYVFSALPGFFLLMACLLARLRSVRVLAAASLVVGALLLADQDRPTTMDLEDWEGMTACIAANAVDGDRILASSPHRPPIDYYWPRVTDGDAPDVASVLPDTLGDVRRIYEPMGSPIELLVEDEGDGSVWYAERSHMGRVFIAGLAFSDEIQARYEMTHPAWYFEGGLTLVRLDPRDGVDRPRASVDCDTVAPPPRGG